MDEEKDEEKKGPSTSSGRTDGGDDSERIASGRNRELQVARGGSRKLFKGKLRRRFLEYFAATANAKWSADRAGIAYQTVWKHRMNDPRFAEAYDRALDQSVARVRAKLVETRIKAKPIEIDGDFDAPELEDVDPQIGLAILREHGWGLTGPSPLGRPRKAGRAPQVASNAEVRAALVKRLEAFGERVWGEGKGDHLSRPSRESGNPDGARGPGAEGKKKLDPGLRGEDEVGA
jgi:hypothetical protein